MPKSSSRFIFIVVLVVAALGVAGGAKSLLIPKLYYPYLEITWPEVVRIQVLQRGHSHASQCERSLASHATVVRGTCPNCKIKTGECRTNLDSTMRHWFDDTSLETPSARMAYGVIVFESPQQQLALAACQASEKQSRANPASSQVTCFPPGVKRTPIAAERDVMERERTEHQELLAVGALSILGLIALVVGAFALIGRYATREPADDVLTETGTDHPAALKVTNILKRVFDIVTAFVLFLILLPVFFVIAALILLLEGAPIFYISRRYISADKSVSIFKFRTMVKDATSPKYRLRERFMRDGYLDIPIGCEVYTSIGRLLERTQFVEMLQVLNILFDGMSFVGNRPLPRDNIDLLKKFDGWQERFDSPAGITGISQIVGKYQLLPQQRLYLERLYASIYKGPQGNILACDLYIFVYTIFLLFTGRYLEYDKAVSLLMRHGADEQLHC